MGDSIVLKIVAYSPDCADSAIRVVPFPKGLVTFPNAFMPTAMENNVFKPLCTGVGEYELWIFNRMGELVFHSVQQDLGWDGSHDGRPCPMGTYVYRCRYVDQITPHGNQFVTGTVTLIR